MPVFDELWTGKELLRAALCGLACGFQQPEAGIDDAPALLARLYLLCLACVAAQCGRVPGGCCCLLLLTTRGPQVKCRDRPAHPSLSWARTDPAWWIHTRAPVVPWPAPTRLLCLHGWLFAPDPTDHAVLPWCTGGLGQGALQGQLPSLVIGCDTCDPREEASQKG